MNLRVRSLKPWSVVIVALVLQAGDDAGPIEPRPAIVPALGVRQVQDGADRAVRNLRLRVVCRKASASQTAYQRDRR